MCIPFLIRRFRALIRRFRGQKNDADLLPQYNEKQILHQVSPSDVLVSHPEPFERSYSADLNHHAVECVRPTEFVQQPVTFPVFPDFIPVRPETRRIFAELKQQHVKTVRPHHIKCIRPQAIKPVRTLSVRFVQPPKVRQPSYQNFVPQIPGSWPADEEVTYDITPPRPAHHRNITPKMPGAWPETQYETYQFRLPSYTLNSPYRGRF